jgi:hypothetical protein
MHTTERLIVADEVLVPERPRMLPPALSRTQRSPAHLRCECGVCGAHSYALPDDIDIQRCGNCLNAGLSPIEEIVQQPLMWGDPSPRDDAPGEIRTRAARVKSPAL